MTTNNNMTRVYTFRIKSELLDTMQALAKKNKRTTPKEIELALEQYIENLQS